MLNIAFRSLVMRYLDIKMTCCVNNALCWCLVFYVQYFYDKVVKMAEVKHSHMLINSRSIKAATEFFFGLSLCDLFTCARA